MGGGGDGGYGDRQARQDAEKAAARNAINVLFGVAPSGAAAVDRSRFERPSGRVYYGDGGQEYAEPGGGFDQAGYDAAVAAAGAVPGEAAKNKAALDSLYGKVRGDAFASGKRRLDEQRDTASRDLRFELFARGLNGGSADVDQNALLGRTYTQGLADLGGKADATATALRTNDETTRVNLLQAIESGMDQGSAVSSALAQMRNNADRASSEAQGLALGNLFADAGLLYDQGRRARGEQAGTADWWRSYGSGKPSSRGATLGSGGNATITRS